MKKNFKSLFFLPAIVLVMASFLFFIFTQAQAQESVGLALSPPTFELSANPGDVLENTLRVENLTSKPMMVLVDRRNFTALGEEGAIGLTEEETSFSLASWMTVTPSEAEIPARSSKTFTFKTNIPLNAEPGGHFGSIIFRVGGQKIPGQTGAVVSQELGALVLLRIAGKTVEQASLESFAAQKRLWEKGPVNFEVRVKGEGNVHLKPTGVITIVNSFGRKVATFNIEPKNVLPGAIRKVEATWAQKFLLGKYTATVSLTYGSQGKILTASTAFFAFPYKIGGIILAVLLVLGASLYRIKERLKLALKVLRGKYK